MPSLDGAWALSTLREGMMRSPRDLRESIVPTNRCGEHVHGGKWVLCARGPIWSSTWFVVSQLGSTTQSCDPLTTGVYTWDVLVGRSIVCKCGAPTTVGWRPSGPSLSLAVNQDADLPGRGAVWESDGKEGRGLYLMLRLDITEFLPSIPTDISAFIESPTRSVACLRVD
jgi:hypothetical protein